MSQPPRSNRAHRERNGDRRQRDPSNDGRSSSDRPSSRPPSYPRTASSRSQTVPREEHHESKCSHICSRRGIVLICSVLTNSLVLMCVIAAQMVTSGMTSMAAMGSFDINTNLNMEGTELQKARELDMQYSQMRAPGVYGGIPFVLIFGVTSLLFVLAGNKPPHVMSWKLLVGSLVFQAVGAVVYVVAVGLYLHFVIMVNSTDVCKQRERLYARSGYTWKNCDVGGADASVALFGLITAILYTAGAVLTFQTVRRVKRYMQERKHIEEERQQDRENKQRAPPSWAATTVL
ncbi:MARVEL domain-containing protein 3 [Micropterus salmoides]|uniref:MARVEL domain-containing protein 3 n=1 Tax=Micropterus salmoides TaxID=27706 RepID=UPI0018EC107C|nr:MARVEL domain-containing protein 3 [Micropterus salmoides]